MTPCKNAAAVKELLSWTEIKDYLMVLEDFWESWLCSEDVNGTSADTRSFYLATYKELKTFFKALEDDEN